MSEKTEKPTPKKIKDARKKGQVGQSQDVPKLMIAAAVLEVIHGMMAYGMAQMQNMVLSPTRLFQQPFEYALQAVLVQSFTCAASMILLAVGLAVIMKLAGSWLQFGFLFAPEALKIDINRLNPASALKQMFSGKKLFELLNNILKTCAIAVVLYLIIQASLEMLIRIPYTTLNGAWNTIAIIFFNIERACLGILLVLAAADFGIQKYFYIKELRMSKDDVKQEYKNTEGDPHVKGQRRSLFREIVESPPPEGVPADKKPDVVVVNPTHYAVALYYQPDATQPDATALPIVLEKGVDDTAKAMIERARDLKVPIVRFVWLARTLYKTETGQFIPRDTLKFVARIYQVLGQLDEEVEKDDFLVIPGLENG